MRSIPRLAPALLIPLGVFALQWAVSDDINPYVWVLFFPAVLFAAVLAGVRGGVLATFVSTFLVWYAFIPPRFSFTIEKPSGLVAVIAFAITGIGFSLFSERLRQANRRLAAHESDEKLRKVLDNAADAVFIANPQKRYIYANGQAAALLGYTVEEILHRGISDLTPPEAASVGEARLQRLLVEGRMHAEVYLRRKDGTLVPVDLNATVLPDGNLFGSCRDISELIHARQALERSEQRYRMAFEISLDAITISRLNDGVCIDVNQSFLDTMGYGRDEVVGRTMLELNIWADPADRRHLAEVLQRDARCANREYRFRKKNGELIGGLMSATVTELDGVPCIFAVTRDITDLKAAQDALERYQTHLEQVVQERTTDLTAANSKLLDTQFAMESVGIGIHWVDADSGRFLYVNYFAAEILGYAVDEMLALRVPDIDPNFDDARFKQTAETLRYQRSMKFESTNRTKDGRIIPVEITCYYLPEKADAPARFISFLTDISQRKATERALFQAKEAAEAASVAKSTFLANMSHEIRTPLHLIIGLGHLLRQDIDDPQQQERLDHLCASSDHLLAIINDILDMSKIEAQQVTINHDDFKPDALVRKLLPMFELRAHEKGLTMTAAIAPQLRGIALNGDALRISQILINLCSNAVKFTDRGAVRLSIGCVAEDAASVTLRIAVEDTGIGIAPAALERLFQPFAQADASSTRKFEGTGLGLAISQRLVALMGGTIQVESRLGTGSTFSFELVLPRATTSVPEAAAVPAAPLQTDFGGSHVLLAEDHPLSQQILVEMLKRLGCAVHLAADGAEAVVRAQERGYDLILMDMQMPRMDGLAATRAIRALPGHRETPIVALTANAFAEDGRYCLDAGMNGHLGKPMTPATLAAALGQWLPNLTHVQGNDTPAGDSELSRALANIPGLDVSHAMLCSSQNLADYCALLSRFMNLHCQDMMRLRAHLAADEYDAAHVVVHKLKGIAGLIGARNIESLTSEIEQALRADADAAIVNYLAALCEAELTSLSETVATLPVALAEPTAP